MTAFHIMKYVYMNVTLALPAVNQLGRAVGIVVVYGLDD
jgi:hypothetical protein